MKSFSWTLIIPIITVIFFDVIFTLIGQPASYWTQTSNYSEVSPLGALTLNSSPLLFLVLMVCYAVIMIILLKKLPFKFSLPLGIALILGHTIGSASWIPVILKKLNLGVNGFLDWYVLIGYVCLIAIIIAHAIKKSLPHK